MSLDDCSQFVAVTFQWPATALLNFKVLISVAKLLESPLHCMLLSSSWAKCVVDVVEKYVRRLQIMQYHLEAIR